MKKQKAPKKTVTKQKRTKKSGIKNKPVAQKKHQKPKQKAAKDKNITIYSLLAIAVIVALTIAIYSPSFKYELTNWDDNMYVTENPYIKNIDSGNLKAMFSDYYMGNYHPLTMLSFAINYQFSEYQADGYRFTNILFHTLNSLLVFWFVYLMVVFIDNRRRADGKKSFLPVSRKKIYALFMAFVAAVFFAVHTIHLESVVWVAERKDVLYTFFFLGSLIAYIFYIKKENYLIYALSFLLFALSLFSKGQAVSLAVTLFLIDIVGRRKLKSAKVILEKVPFLALALVFGLLAIKAQEASGAIAAEMGHSLLQKLIFSSYGFSQYFAKLIAPLPQFMSALYPYPRLANGIPMKYILHIVPTLLIIFLMIYSLRRRSFLAFGLWFFAINIALVLQLIQVGGAIMADRYSYVPSIGFCMLLGVGTVYLYEIVRTKLNSDILKGGLVILLAVYIGFVVWASAKRLPVWENTLTLWNDVINKFDENTGSAEAWVNRGNYKYKQDDFPGALSDYDNALKLNANLAEALTGRGVARRNLGDYNGALKDYNKAIEIKPKNAETYSNRGVTKAKMNNFEDAIEDFNKALSFDSTMTKAHSNKGSAYFKLGKMKPAIKSFNKAIALDPDYAEAYANRGSAYTSLGQYEQALNDFTRAVQLRPDYVMGYMNRAILYQSKLNNYEEAIKNCNKIVELDPKNKHAYYIRGMSNINIGNKENGCKDLQMSLKLGYKGAAKDIEKHCR